MLPRTRHISSESEGRTRKTRSSKITQSCRRCRRSDALWRDSMACYFEMLRRLLPPCDRTNKRKRGRAKVLKAAMEHLRFLESTILLLLDGTLQDLDHIKHTFRRIVESENVNTSASAEQNEVPMLAGKPSSLEDGGNEPYTHHRRKHRHDETSNRTTQRRSPLGDVTSKVASITNTARNPHGHRSYNDNTANLKVVAMQQPVLIEEECLLGGLVTLEEVQVVPSEDISIAPLETFDYSSPDDEQIVPQVGNEQTSYLQWTTQEPLNLKIVRSATNGDPLLGSAQQPGSSSPDLPLSAFSDLCWSSVGWVSDDETAASSQELSEHLW